MKNFLRLRKRRDAAPNESTQSETVSRRELRAKRKEQKLQRREEKIQRRSERKQRRRRQSQLLQSKLTRSYRMVTVAAVFFIVTVGSWLLWHLVFRYAPPPQTSATWALRSARDAAPLLQTSPPDRARLMNILKPLTEKRMTSAVTDVNGVVLASAPENILRVGMQLQTQTQLPPGAEKIWNLARRGESRPQLLGDVAADGSSFAVVPIIHRNRVLGLLWVRSAKPVHPGDFGEALFVVLLVSGIGVGIFAAVVGTVFGFLTARRLTQRLENISSAADAWGKGDFYVVANDESEDEIGQLARRLNKMASELQQLVALRQNLATSEERNRLARELHDTVKQQVFATAMQVGAARALLERDPDAAKLRLTEAEKLARGAQGELTGILEQLRPGSYSVLRAPDFENLLRQTAADWSRQSGIAAEVSYQNATPFSPDTQQALLRIVQEALSNAARHSGASRVLIWVNDLLESGETELVIQDDGQGFSVEKNEGGMGLRNMRERAEALTQGTFKIENQGGTRLCVKFRN